LFLFFSECLVLVKKPSSAREIIYDKFYAGIPLEQSGLPGHSADADNDRQTLGQGQSGSRNSEVIFVYFFCTTTATCSGQGVKDRIGGQISYFLHPENIIMRK